MEPERMHGGNRMRKYPQKIDEEILAENFESTLEFIDDVIGDQQEADEDENAMYFKILGQEYRSAAAFGYALEQAAEGVVKHMEKADACFEKAVDFEILMDPYEYIDHLSMAIVMGNKGLAERLCGFSEQDYASEDVDAGKIIYLLARIEAAIAMGDDEDLGAALAEAQKQLGKKNAKYDKLMTQALVSLARAICENDQKAFDDALAARAKDFARLNAHPDDRESPEALMDIPGMAFIRVGLSKGLKCGIGSVYWPETILWR